MTGQSQRSALARKLVSTFHLSARERAAFAPGSVAGSQIKAAVLALLHEHGAFPPRWKGARTYDGGLLVLNADGKCSVTWMGEVALGRYEVLEREEFESASEAVERYAPRFFGESIDGIVVRWLE